MNPEKKRLRAYIKAHPHSKEAREAAEKTFRKLNTPPKAAKPRLTSARLAEAFVVSDGKVVALEGQGGRLASIRSTTGNRYVYLDGMRLWENQVIRLIEKFKAKN